MLSDHAAQNLRTTSIGFPSGSSYAVLSIRCDFGSRCRAVGPGLRLALPGAGRGGRPGLAGGAGGPYPDQHDREDRDRQGDPGGD